MRRPPYPAQTRSASWTWTDFRGILVPSNRGSDAQGTGRPSGILPYSTCRPLLIRLGRWPASSYANGRMNFHIMRVIWSRITPTPLCFIVNISLYQVWRWMWPAYRSQTIISTLYEAWLQTSSYSYSRPNGRPDSYKCFNTGHLV